MLKKIIRNTNIIVIATIIIISSILIGGNLTEENGLLPYTIIGIYGIIYYAIEIYKKIRKSSKEQTQIDTIDILCIILTVSTFIPLIFKTYISISEQILMSIKYVSVLIMYLIIKKECRKHPEYKDIIINVIILTILMQCIIGLDEINRNYLKDFKQFVGCKIVTEDSENKMCSLYSYANAFAIMVAVGIYLCGYKIVKEKSKIKKGIFSIIALIMLITFALTYSRLGYIAFIVIGLAIFIVAVKKYKLYKNINKKVIFAIISIIVIGAIYILIGLKVPGILKTTKSYQKIIYSAKADADYNFEFDIESEIEGRSSIVITITEKNEYHDETKRYEQTIGNFEGTKEFKFHTQENTDIIFIDIKVQGTGKITINSVKLNGEDFILKYKYLETKVVDKIKSINLKDKCAWERFAFMQDAGKLIKDNWIFGYGANAWRSMLLKTQSYKYYSREVHCYPIQIFLEYGIIGFISCVGIMLYVIKQYFVEIKSKEKQLSKTFILGAILVVFAHSIFDFDMSYFYIQLIVFTLIAITSSEKKGKPITNNLAICGYSILILETLFNIYHSSIKFGYNVNYETKKKEKINQNQQFYIDYAKLIPYDLDLKLKRIGILSTSKIEGENKSDLIKKLLKTERYHISNLKLKYPLEYFKEINEEYQINEQDFEEILEYMQETEEFAKYQVDIQRTRLENLKKIVDILKEIKNEKWSQKFEEHLYREIEKKREYILDYNKSRYRQENVKEHEEFLEQLIST